MNTLEILLSKRWILKSREKELYYQVKDQLGKYRDFLNDKLGYHIVVTPNLIKLEKVPAQPENWMGIPEFKEKTEYIFLCLVLMFLEDKEAEEQFVLSDLTEYVQSQWKEYEVDWTVYRNRRCFVKVLKFCVNCGILKVDDGNEENFSKDNEAEVLYENTGVSRYFMRNFAMDISGFTSPLDFVNKEWIGMDEDRGIIRRQRVYRKLLMAMGVYKTEDTEEDFLYIKNYRNIIQGELSGLADCQLHVHKNSAFLVLGEECHMGRCFPEGNTLSDITLLCGGIIREMLEIGEITCPVDEKIIMPVQKFIKILENCKEKYQEGFPKKYREMTTNEFVTTVKQYMEEMELAGTNGTDIYIQPALGKMKGVYPDNFKLQKGAKDE